MIITIILRGFLIFLNLETDILDLDVSKKNGRDTWKVWWMKIKEMGESK